MLYSIKNDKLPKKVQEMLYIVYYSSSIRIECTLGSMNYTMSADDIDPRASSIVAVERIVTGVPGE